MFKYDALQYNVNCRVLCIQYSNSIAFIRVSTSLYHFSILISTLFSQTHTVLFLSDNPWQVHFCRKVLMFCCLWAFSIFFICFHVSWYKWHHSVSDPFLWTNFNEHDTLLLNTHRSYTIWFCFILWPSIIPLFVYLCVFHNFFTMRYNFIGHVNRYDLYIRSISIIMNVEDGESIVSRGLV